jgi:DHA1 family tetracycline resistance protein-like MFS transporter
MISVAASSGAFRFNFLLIANMACTMAMISFVSLVGPIARLLGLLPWQAGAAMTLGGVLWMLLSRPWGALSDRLGRRRVLLLGVGGFALAYWAMCAVFLVSLHTLPAASLVFAGLLLTRGAIGAFYAAIPAGSQALIADHVALDARAGAMATLGAANALGLVAGPALAALLARHSLSLPLYASALLPLLAYAVLWRTLPPHKHAPATRAPPLKLRDARLRYPMRVAFVATFCITVGQITAGFFALDRLALAPAAAAQAAGAALTAMGMGLVGCQLVVRRLDWPPLRLVRVGASVAALGFAASALAFDTFGLVAAFFLTAIGMGGMFPAFPALAANAVQAQEQGAAAGSIGAAQGLGIVSGPFVATLLYAAAPVAPYALAAVMLTILASPWAVPKGIA